MEHLALNMRLTLGLLQCRSELLHLLKAAEKSVLIPQNCSGFSKKTPFLLCPFHFHLYGRVKLQISNTIAGYRRRCWMLSNAEKKPSWRHNGFHSKTGKILLNYFLHTRVWPCWDFYFATALNFLVSGPKCHCFEISSGSVISPPESVGAVQPVSKSIELILLWRRWEPEPWQPSAQIRVGRELAGDTLSLTHIHMHKHIHKQINICVCVCCQIEPDPLDPDRYRCSFIGCTDWIEAFLSPTEVPKV